MSELNELRREMSDLTHLVKRLSNPIPFEKQLWGRDKLAEFFNCSVDSVDRIIKANKATFPQGRRRNIQSDRGSLLWRAKEVTDWAIVTGKPNN